MMDICSVEDEDCSELFTTQNSKGIVSDSLDSGPILGDGSNFRAPLISLTPNFNVGGDHYEDISEDDFDIPSSQVMDCSKG